MTMTKLKMFLAGFVVALALIGAFGLGMYYNARITTTPNSSSSSQKFPNNETVEETDNKVVSNTPTVTNTATPVKITWTKDEVIKAVSAKSGIPLDKIKVSIGETIDKGDKILMRGTVGEVGEVSGAGWFAVITTAGVNVTYVGQGVPECSEVNPFGYPTSWADYCMSNGNTVKR